MGGGGGGGESGEPEFQIAPMVDVLLVLLIFFMSITVAQVSQVDKKIELPVATDAKKKDDKNSMNEALLNIGWDTARQEATIKYADREYKDPQVLIDKLTDLKNRNPKYRCIIRGDKRLPAIEIQKVMTIIGQSGIDDISFSALNHT
jgi:biopolymer transport protein ExbD